MLMNVLGTHMNVTTMLNVWTLKEATLVSVTVVILEMAQFAEVCLLVVCSCYPITPVHVTKWFHSR